jgi:hypothetical protein
MNALRLLTMTLLLTPCFAASAADPSACQELQAGTNFLASKGAAEQLVIAQGVNPASEAAVARGKQIVPAAGGGTQTFYERLAYAFHYISNLDKYTQERIEKRFLKPQEGAAFKAKQKRALAELIRNSGFVIQAFGVYANSQTNEGYLVSIPYDVSASGDLVQLPKLCIEETLTKVDFFPLASVVEKLNSTKTDRCQEHKSAIAFSCAGVGQQLAEAGRRPELLVLIAQTARKDGAQLLITGGTDSGSIYDSYADGTASERVRLQVFGVQRSHR